MQRPLWFIKWVESDVQKRKVVASFKNYIETILGVPSLFSYPVHPGLVKSVPDQFIWREWTRVVGNEGNYQTVLILEVCCMYPWVNGDRIRSYKHFIPTIRKGTDGVWRVVTYRQIKYARIPEDDDCDELDPKRLRLTSDSDSDSDDDEDDDINMDDGGEYFVNWY